ncbi:MAG: leucyl/phenylalanyl-tRNA--protein transferase [Sphingobacteriaceae bacterium]|nr:leucyl/phenylalanyl-tRNA--protein transferase [Sphingobacteriaceae bacterium]
MIFQLDNSNYLFPNPILAEDDGLLAIGGDLSVGRLKAAYQNGIFPWFSDHEPICWYAPKERCVIYPEEIKISKSMQKVLKNNTFEITQNNAFKEVIENCAFVFRKDQNGTWITKEMQKAYLNLHTQGWAHSIEVWQNKKLVGGLYGVVINDVFCGESMFSLVSNASKIALIELCKTKKYKLIDCQIPNDHLLSLGAKMINQNAFLECLGNC